MDQLVEQLSVVSMDFVDVGQRQTRPKQEISVPFLWEQTPGKPKQSWPSSIVAKDNALRATTTATQSAVSVPFQWEQKPGTPLSRFVPAWLERKLTGGTASHHHNPLVILHGYDDNLLVEKPEDDENSSLLSDGFQADSYTSKACETGSSGGSTTAVMDDGSGLELLYPLALAPPAPGGFLSKVTASERAGSRGELDVWSAEHAGGAGTRSGRALVVRKTMTLAELMLLSRKLSYAASSPLLLQKVPKRSCTRDFIGPFEKFMRKKLLACF